MNRRIVRVIGIVTVALVTGALGCSKSSESNKTTPLAPPAVGLNGFTFNEIYNCSQSPASGIPYCADRLSSDQVQFTKTSSNTYSVRDVPDTGFFYSGTLSGLQFTWTAVSPNGYTETGTWTFAADGLSFTGISHYVANDNSYSGDCNTTGAKAPAMPPAPAGIGACP
jgi:hypothetical protein